MNASTGDLRDALRELAAELAGVALPDDADPDPRTELLWGAALLTGRGDLAQDAVHVATCRVRLADAVGDRGCGELRGEVTRTARGLLG